MISPTMIGEDPEKLMDIPGFISGTVSVVVTFFMSILFLTSQL